MYFVTCPKQGLEMEAVVLHRVAFLEYFCPKQGQDFKPSAAPLYPNMGQEPPPPGQIPRCTELNAGQMPRDCPGGGWAVLELTGTYKKQYCMFQRTKTRKTEIVRD